MKISEVMKVTDLTKKAINYYEDSGLIKPCVNEENNYRDYSDSDVEKLKQIGVLRRFGLPVSRIKEAMKEPKNMYLVLENYMQQLNEQIRNMERCKSILGSCMGSFKEETRDISKITEEMMLLKDAVEMSQKEREGFMEGELIRIFPGAYGKMLSISLGMFLEEPLDSKEKEEAWISVVRIIDETKSIVVTKDIEEYLENRIINWDKIRNSIIGEMEEIFKLSSEEEKHEFDFNKIDFTEDQQENLKMFFLYFKKEENMNIIINLFKKIEGYLIVLSSKFKALTNIGENSEEDIFNENYDDIYENIKEIKISGQRELKLIGVEYTKFIKKTKIPELIEEFKQNIHKIKNICDNNSVYGIAGVDSIYKDWNKNNNVFSYVLAVEVESIEQVPEGMLSVIIPEHEYLKCRYEGSIYNYYKLINYMFLQCLEEKKLEVDSFPNIDIFNNSPKLNDEFQVHMWIPIKHK